MDTVGGTPLCFAQSTSLDTACALAGAISKSFKPDLSWANFSFMFFSGGKHNKLCNYIHSRVHIKNGNKCT